MNFKEDLTNLDLAFAARVEKWMRDTGVGRQGAAVILGLSRSQLWRLLTPEAERREKCSVTLERWMRLARALHVPVGDLINESLADIPSR
jgi:hypothetical protein